LNRVVADAVAARSFRIDSVAGSATSIHGADVDLDELAEVGRIARWCEVDAPALVLGSSQPESDVDRRVADEAGIEVVRRRSGGGAVLLVPGESVWLDVVLAAGDPLWHDDVGAAMWWLGDVWAEAITAARAHGTVVRVGSEERSIADDGTVAHPAGVAEATPTVHRGGLVTSAWSRRVCFDGIGDGEVVVGGHKLVGISQRRTRHWCRLQSSVHLVWRRDLVAELLRVPRQELRMPAVVTAPPMAHVEHVLRG
jgi:lipoate-protein ligase A